MLIEIGNPYFAVEMSCSILFKCHVYNIQAFNFELQYKFDTLQLFKIVLSWWQKYSFKVRVIMI